MQSGTRRAFGFGLAWLGATALAVIVAAAAVGSVRSQVTDTPTPLGSPETAALAADASNGETAVGADGAPQDEVPPSQTPEEPGPSIIADEPIDDIEAGSTTIPDTPTTEPPPSTTTTVAQPSETTTTTSSPPDSTTTTTVPDSYTRTYDTVAGSVRIRVEGESVVFAGAFPQPGWTVELKSGGPEKVEVEFEENEGEGEVGFSAKVEDGELVVDIEVE